MKPYIAILSSRFRTLLQYRAAAIAGVGTQLFFGLVRMMIFDAFYRSTTADQPLSHSETVTYIWLGQAFILLTLFGVDTDVALMIRNGNVAYEMTRPVDLYKMWFARALSGRAAPMSMRVVPILVVAGIFFGLTPPASFTAAALFHVSIVGGLLLGASMVTILTISMLWTISGEGISRLAPALVFIFSGIAVPLPFFPDWLQPLIAVLPFRGLMDTPFRVYLGHLAGTDALLAIAHQVLWLLALCMSGKWMLSIGIRRLVVQGG